jgi:hypothetical protein
VTRITTYTCDHCGKAVTSTTGYPGGWTMDFTRDGGDFCTSQCMYDARAARRARLAAAAGEGRDG